MFTLKSKQIFKAAVTGLVPFCCVNMTLHRPGFPGTLTGLHETNGGIVTDLNSCGNTLGEMLSFVKYPTFV